MDSSDLNSLVPLANLGCSGVCVLGVFTAGGLIISASAKSTPSPELFKAIRWFMGMCVVMAFISGVTGIYNAFYSQQKIAHTEAKVSDLQLTLNDQASELAKAKAAGAELSQSKLQVADLEQKLQSLSSTLAGPSTEDVKNQLRQAQAALADSQNQVKVLGDQVSEVTAALKAVKANRATSTAPAPSQ